MKRFAPPSPKRKAGLKPKDFRMTGNPKKLKDLRMSGGMDKPRAPLRVGKSRH